MTTEHDTLTILSCHMSGGSTGKTFTAMPDGMIIKEVGTMGMYFQYQETRIAGLNDILEVLRKLQTEPQKCIIRGKPMHHRRV